MSPYESTPVDYCNGVSLGEMWGITTFGGEHPPSSKLWLINMWSTRQWMVAKFDRTTFRKPRQMIRFPSECQPTMGSTMVSFGGVNGGFRDHQPYGGYVPLRQAVRR